MHQLSGQRWHKMAAGATFERTAPAKSRWGRLAADRVNRVATLFRYQAVMDARFSFDVDTARDLVCATLSGFFSLDDVRRFIAARNSAQRRLRCRPNQHLTLVDIREMQIQSQESVAEFRQMLADPRAQGRAIAFVVSQSLARMQAQRIANERFAGYFGTLGQAEAWLLAQGATAAA